MVQLAWLSCNVVCARMERDVAASEDPLMEESLEAEKFVASEPTTRKAMQGRALAVTVTLRRGGATVLESAWKGDAMRSG